MNFNKSFFVIIFLSFLVSNSFANDFYWVGNSGAWTDSNHWANTSGGAGGIGVPTLNDDVYFDNNSFSQGGTVSILTNGACKSFTFNTVHQVEFSSLINHTLEVKGDFIVNQFFENHLYGSTIFSSNQLQTQLSSYGHEFLGDIEFNGAGSWLLIGDLITTDSNYIYLKQGNLIVNNITIYSGGIDAQGAKSKTINLNNAVLYNHNKALFNSTNFNLINNQSNFIINGSASSIELGNILESEIAFSANTKLTNTCGIIPFTVTTSVLISNPGGFGVSCDATCDATTFATVTGGVGPFTYLWSASGTPSAGLGDTLFNTCQGNVGIQVTDVGQGTQCTDQVFVTNPIGLVVNLTQAINPTCNGNADGSISTNVAFGSPPYAISWVQVPDLNASISNLAAGPYDILVIDTNGCTTNQSYMLSNPPFVTFQLDSTNILCAGMCTGTASVSSIAGGNGAPYNYLWTSNPAGQVPASEQGTPSLTNLCPGTYSVTVGDSSGCFLTRSITITIPDTIQLSSSQTNVSCGGVCDGTITSSVSSGGVGPFTHNWNTAPFVFVGNTSTITGLCAGTYTDSIVDANGCDTVITFIITEPIPLVTTSNSTDVTCFSFCNGTIATNTSGGTGPYTYLWSSNTPGLISGQGTDSIFDLCPGQYIVNITDFNLCTTADTIVITEPDLLVSNLSSTDATCFGICNGNASPAPTGGTGNPLVDFTYSWTGPGGPYNTQTINSLCPGNYELIITDANGCMDTNTAIVTEPSAISLSIASIGITCNGICNGSAATTASGGTGNPNTDFTYTWVSMPAMPIPTGQGTPNITDLCAGTYTVTVTDALGCTENNSIMVNEPNAILINLATRDLSCNGICNGSATVSPTGGNGPYSISWNGATSITIPNGGSNTITGLCAGNQDVIVTDVNGCSTHMTFNIVEPTLLTTSTTNTIISCNGDCNGSAITSPTGGSGTYTFNWTSIPAGQVTSGQGTANITNLCAGTYIVSITDDSLCVLLDTVVITEPLAVNPNAQFTNITCNGLADGTAVALPIGGEAPYASITWFNLTSGTTVPGNPITNLTAGQYEITVIDNNGCTGIDTITIIDPLPFTVDATPTVPSCGTICNGAITAITSGGTGNPATDFTYQWDDLPSPGQTTQTASNLCAGEYTVVVNDLNGCIATDFDTVVTVVTISITTNTVNNGCNTLCDGDAVASGNGGVAPYTYAWTSNPPGIIGSFPGDSIFGLCQGFVHITVTDANGCASSDSAFVPAAPSVFQLNSTTTNVLCNNDSSGSATIAPSGGVPPYTNILWSTGSTNLSISNLSADTYWVTATDAVGCIVTDTFTISQPDTISPNPTITNISCNGDSTGSICLAPTGGTPTYSFLWSGGLGNAACIINQPAGNYSVTITDTNNCSRTEIYTIVEPTPFTSNPFSMDVSCFGDSNGIAAVTLIGGFAPYTCSWNTGAMTDTISNLFPGNYSVICLDSNGCSTTQNITVNEPALLDANVSGTSIACGGFPCTGTAISNTLGGTTGYSYQWSSLGGNPILPNSTSGSINNLCEDTYNLTVTDLNGCTATGQYIVSQPTTLAVTLDSTNVSCNGESNGSATASVLGGTPPYSYSWIGGCLTSTDTNQTINNLCAGIYTITITDALGCFFTGSININEPTVIEINETVTPANCGVNDGVISTSPSGGQGPYTHSWNNGATTNTITSLFAGLYTDTITDFNGCTVLFTIPVNNPTAPSGVVTTVNDASCFGSCDGSLNVIPIGGASPYSYSWTSVPPGGPYPGDSTLMNLCAGNYNITITDASGCIFSTSIIVGQSDSIDANLSFNNASCDDICDGTASISPTGGTAPYTFLWSDGSTNSSVSGLCTGPANVIITDFNGCSKTENFNIASPNALTLSSTANNVLCNGSCDGTATVNVLGGTGNYTYQWNDPSSQTTATASNLCPGTYIVTVSDNNSCSINDTIAITEPSLIIPNITTTDATCGNSDGSAIAAPTGGAGGPYTFLWCNNVTAPITNGLAAGTCSLQITDINGCSQTFLVPISNSVGPEISVTSTNASCNGICDGTASVSVTSGAPNYTYLWNNGATTNSITGLCAGNYTVDVTDMNGCISVESVTINENTPISAIVSFADATCNATCDGWATVTPSGGIPPYSYNWNTGQSTNAIGGLCPGNYNVTITDVFGCSIIQDVTIDEPLLLSSNVTGSNATCNNGNDGTATAIPSGGTAPYSFLWSNNATTSTIVGLSAGSYSVVVTDNNGCTTNGMVSISDGSSINSIISSTDATCGQCDGTASATNPTGGVGGYTYLWLPGGETTQNINNLCPGLYSLNITDNAGCSQIYNVLISNPSGPILTVNSDSTSCFSSCDGAASVLVNSGSSPYTYQWNDPLLSTNDTATGLCAGFYAIIVQDDLGCISIDSTTVQQPSEILANITFTSPSCVGSCDGTATANPNGAIGTTTFLWNNGQTTPTATNLCAGTHILTITDANGCSIIDSITIMDPSPINVTISSTLPTCDTDCDATALATVSGGNPSYTYSWNTTPVQNNALATNLCAGNYELIVTDNNNCNDTSTIQIVDPVLLTTTSSSTAPSCNGNCDGIATTNPTGGVLPYTFIWNSSPTQTTATATGLCSGSYVVTIIDGNNCIITDTVIVTDPIIINDSTLITSPNCGVCNGAATSTPVGGSGAYNFVWTDAATSSIISLTVNQASSTVVGLCAGVVNLEITDIGTGCIYNYTHIINSINNVNIDLSSTNETCPSACDGTALALVSGGTAPYTYNWNTIPNQTDSNLTNLCVGDYTITVTDSSGCITSDTITIETNDLDLVVSNIVPETCFDACDGVAVVTANAGNAPYNYLWTPSNQATPTATNLCTGLYTAVVIDATACRDSISATVTGPDELMISATINTALACNGQCNGSIIANVIGGSGNYTYSWNTIPVQTTQIANNLCAGTYIVIATDANGCSISDTVELTEPTPILANENLILPTCNLCDGQITISPTGGIGPYTFLWTSPSSVSGNPNSVITNLCADAYSVEITDVTNCTVTFNFALSNLIAPSANTSAIDVSCNGLCDGQLSTSPSGGTAPYTINWNPGGTSNPLTNLCAGIYTINVTDAMGCIGVAIDSIIEPDPIEANMTFTNITCTGLDNGEAIANPTGGTPNYNYVWTPTQPNSNSVTNLTPGIHQVTIMDMNGCSTIDSINILEPSPITSTSTQIDATCSAVCDGSATVNPIGGSGIYSYQWNGNTTLGQTATQTGLCVGQNTVLTTDQNGCSIIDTINIGAIDTVFADAGIDMSICEGSSVNLIGTVTGAMSGVEWFELPGMTLIGTTDTISVTPSGIGTTCYIYRVNGSCSDEDTVCITTNSAPIVNAGSDVNIFENASTLLSGSGIGSYSWSPGGSLSDSTSSTPNATPLTTTTYTLTVTSPSGCIASDDITVIVLPEIRFADGITPNGDGANDVWIIDFIDEFPNNVVEIYNRWGELLFHADGYQQNWDGTYEGKELPIGTYYYIIDLKDDSLKPFTGPVTILR